MGTVRVRDGDKIDPETYNKIEKLNETEVFYQNANNYLEELVENNTSYNDDGAWY